MSLPYFRGLGWEPVIICVDEQYVEGTYRDELLTETYSAVPCNVSACLRL